MAYVKPGEVHSPKVHWRLIEILLDRGEGDCAYALGKWDDVSRIGFRWNGTKDNPIGNPQSRGLPTWTMLDPNLHEAVIALLPKEKRPLARRFLGTGVLFDGVSLSSDHSSVLLWDIRQSPAIVAKIDCGVIRDVVGDPKINEEDCRLVADVNRELLTEIAEEMFSNGQYETRDDGVRVIVIGHLELVPLSRRFSTSVLRIAAQARWIK
ncbi:MAG TPA: hypothetical protein VMH84_15160 [Xanthobacteraceae bacterium]|nr:hypothetical protein [Xanthobacteraceae bacterium]